MDADILHRISLQATSLLNSANNYLTDDIKFHSVASSSSSNATPRANSPVSQSIQTPDHPMSPTPQTIVEEEKKSTIEPQQPQTQPEIQQEDVNMEQAPSETTTTNEEKMSEEEIAQQKEQEEEEKKSMLKIETVTANLGRIQNQIRVLHETTDPLTLTTDESTIMEGQPLKTKSTNLEKLQKTCLLYSEELFKNLLSLDSLVNLPATKRPLRKQTVSAIQSLLSDVDSVNMKLRKLKEVIDERLKIEEEKTKAEEETKRKEQEQLQKQEQEKRKQAEQERKKQYEQKRKELEEKKKQEEEARKQQQEVLQEEERKHAAELRYAHLKISFLF